MNRVIAILLTLFGLLAQDAFSATTGNIVIQGSIPQSVNIEVNGVGNYNSLDLTSNQSNLNVASVREMSNALNGYTVTLSSTNSGKLKNGTAEIAYTAKYNGSNVTLSSSPVQVSTQGAQTSVVDTTKSLSISYTGVSAASTLAGTYSDTLTFTISAN